MFKTHSMKRFDAAGGANQEIQLNQFAIRKQVDVKRLKYQLWESMEPILIRKKESEVGDVEMREEAAMPQSAETRPDTSGLGTGNEKPLTASDLLADLYYG